ncbi:MAG: lysophospholipid acyltransferase family protein [Fluviibacter sp.]
MSNRVMPWVATCIFKSLAYLPLSVLQTFGLALGWIGWKTSGSFQRLSAENFKQAFPAATPQMLRRAMLSVGQMFLEMPYWWVRRNDRALNKTVAPADWHLFETALATGKGVILLSPHMGCFELLGPVYSSRFQSTVLFRPPRKVWLREWIVNMRTRKQLKMAPANQTGVRSLVRTLLKGQTVGILPDQVPVLGEGVWAPFFGRPAYTMTLVQRLQSLTGAKIFMLGVERLGVGQGYKMHIAPMDTPLSDDPVEAATQINVALEAMIRQAPTQYLWGYNRYKQPVG